MLVLVLGLSLTGFAEARSTAPVQYYVDFLRGKDIVVRSVLFTLEPKMKTMGLITVRGVIDGRQLTLTGAYDYQKINKTRVYMATAFTMDKTQAMALYFTVKGHQLKGWTLLPYGRIVQMIGKRNLES
jgi:hypothetical protein